MLSFSLFDNIYVKELTNEEFYGKIDYSTTRNAIEQLGVRAMQENPTKSEKIAESIEVILNKMEKAARSFGLYDSEKYFGYISFARYESDTPEIQIELYEEYRYRGIGYDALQNLIRMIFEEREDIKHFIYCVRFDNFPSIKLIEKLGGKLIERGDLLDKIIRRYHIER